MTFIFLSRFSINDVKKKPIILAVFYVTHISIIIYIISSDTNYIYENSDGILKNLTKDWPRKGIQLLLMETQPQTFLPFLITCHLKSRIIITQNFHITSNKQ